MKRLVPLALAIPLLLAACSTGTDETSEPAPTIATTELETSTSATTTEAAEAEETAEEATESSTDTSPDSEPTTSLPPADPPAQQQPESIWTAPWEGYNCPGTDAWVIDSVYCTPENLGGEPLIVEEDPGTPLDGFDYAPYGHDEYGIPIVPDHATDWERCSMLAGMLCTDQMMAEWNAVNDYAATQQDMQDGQSWWGDCIAVNTAEYCRANDPWQQ